MRRHTAAPRAGFKMKILSLLTLLAAAPAFAGGPGDATPEGGAEEGVVTLTDRAPRAAGRATANADAAVTPASLTGGGCETGCETGCGDACDGGACGGACGDGACGGAGGSCLDRFNLCCPECNRRLGPVGVCRACGASGVPCRVLRGGACGPNGCGPGVCLPGLPCLGVPGACLPGAGLLCRGIPYWTPDGGPESCYLCSLLGIGANACNGRHGLAGRYEHVYAVNPGYTDRRDGNVWAAASTGVPMAVPLAPNVRHTMEYGWGLPSSRLVNISRPAPPSYLYGPPENTAVELPRTRKGRVQSLPIIPELGQGALHDHRTGVGFPRRGSADFELSN